jgi:hypothetical protein
MFRVAVIYAPNDEAMRSLAERIAGSLDRKRFTAKVKPAAKAAVSDLAAADLVLLGAAARGRGSLHPDFTELARSLTGISLAGRVAGLFATEGEGPLAALKRALRDTDIRLDPDNSLRADLAAAGELASWLAGLGTQLDQTRRAR